MEPRHGLWCSIMGFGPREPGEPIDYATACRSYHCGWCGEPCSSHGCGCEWSERRVERPADDPERPLGA